MDFGDARSKLAVSRARSAAQAPATIDDFRVALRAVRSFQRGTPAGLRILVCLLSVQRRLVDPRGGLFRRNAVVPLARSAARDTLAARFRSALWGALGAFSRGLRAILAELGLRTGLEGAARAAHFRRVRRSRARTLSMGRDRAVHRAVGGCRRHRTRRARAPAGRRSQ